MFYSAYVAKAYPVSAFTFASAVASTPPIIRQKPREQTRTNMNDFDREALNLLEFSGRALRITVWFLVRVQAGPPLNQWLIGCVVFYAARNSDKIRNDLGANNQIISMATTTSRPCVTVCLQVGGNGPKAECGTPQ